MAFKLGEILVQKGILSEGDLKKALEAQLIYGAHLGTCLIELGYLEEDTLGRILSEIYGVHYADRARLQDVPPAIIGLLPQPVIEKHHVIPFEISGQTLRVAMVNPKNLHALDEISFVSGRRIEPWIAPEVRIFQAMERYYEIPRRLRYVTLCRQLDSNRKAPEAPRAEAVQVAQAGSAAGLVALRPLAAPAEGSEEVASTGSTRDRGGFEPARRAQAASPARTAEPPAQARPAVRGDDFAELAGRLCAAEDLEALGEAIMDFATGRMDRCLLFSVRGGRAGLWTARGLSMELSRQSQLDLPITTEPVFRLPGGDPFYLGPPPEDAGRGGLFGALPGTLPGSILVLPVHCNDRLVAVLYGDSPSPGGLRASVEECQRLVQVLSLSFNILILKRKIRAV